MVRFDRIIPPGGRGNISLKVNLTGLSGAIQKSARVYTNDPSSSSELLAIKAFVKVPIKISPQQVNLTGDEGSIINRSVIITANEEKSLELEPLNFSFNEMVTYQLEVIEKGKKFKVNFKTLPEAEGTFKGSLILKTNYPEKPEIRIHIKANIKKNSDKKKRDVQGRHNPNTGSLQIN